MNGKPADTAEPRPIGRVRPRAEDWLTGLMVDARRGHSAGRRTLYLVAALAVAFLFLPEALTDMREPISWAMIALALIFALFVWKFPDWHNKRYARLREEKTPEAEVFTSLKEVMVRDAWGEERFSFQGSFQVVEYREVMTLLGEKGRVSVVPLGGLPEQEREQFISLLRRQLGERYEKAETLRARGFHR